MSNAWQRVTDDDAIAIAEALEKVSEEERPPWLGDFVALCRAGGFYIG